MTKVSPENSREGLLPQDGPASSEAGDCPPLTARIDLNVGYSCNMKCNFCYYLSDVKARRRDKDLTTAQCKGLMAYFRRRKMDVLDLTGGEPTIRKDILELACHARTVAGFRTVSMITNGVRLADKTFARDLVQAGVSDFLFSLQGSTAAMHEGVTGLPGSYQRLLTAIGNLLALGVRVRCNSVITGQTLPDVPDRAALLAGMGVKTLNYIMYNPIEQQSEGADQSNFVRYSDAAALLSEVIDRRGGEFDKLIVRYMPFCIMPGHLRHLQGVHQVHYDHDEWNYLLRARVREPYLKWLAGVVYGQMVLPGKAVWRRRGKEQMRRAAILEANSRLKKCRPPSCRACSYGFICGGVWKNYFRHFGDGELRTQDGPLLLDPWHFMDEAARATPAWLKGPMPA